MWIYYRCHSCQCLCPGRVNGFRDWRKVWNALNEAPYLSFLVQQMRTIHQAVEHRCLSITLLVEWPVSFLNLFALICSLPVMLWKQGLKSFSLPSWQVALTPYAKLTSRNTACFDICSAGNKYRNMGRSHVQLQEEISSDKEQLSMKPTWGKKSVIWIDL